MPVACFLGRGKVLWPAERIRDGCGLWVTVVAAVSVGLVSKVSTNNSKTPDFFVKTGVFFIQSYPAEVTRRA